MNDANQKLSEEGLANLAIDPDLLARELAVQLAGDPLDELELDKTDDELANSSKECDLALKWLQSGNEEKLRENIPNKILLVGEAIRKNINLKEINKLSKIDPWFLNQIKEIIESEI